MALLITYLDHGYERVEEIYTKVGVERFVRLHGTACLIDVKGALPFLPQRNVGAERDWLDVMSGGTYEFDLDEVEAQREKEWVESQDWMFD